MTGMNIQERYDDISRISGLSEDIIRRVYKATRQSLAQSLKRGERATLPGICTFTPEISSRINRAKSNGEYITKEDSAYISRFIKIKVGVSSALESELEKIANFEDEDILKARDMEEEAGLQKLMVKDTNADFQSFRQYGSGNGIRTTQISALL
ncbi:MAG: hypothetical protein U0L26_07545 [Cellulosilyticum sp.]|nr:hypothetical protein [Cellulosilyticum sp.]